MLLPADLHALGLDLRRAALRRRRRAQCRAVAFVAIVALGAGAGVAVATSLLGSPAPRGAQIDLHRAVAWVNAPGLRLQTAKVVAASPAATLYSIADKRGNYCVELIGQTNGLIFGFGCESTQVYAVTHQLLFSGTAPGASYVDAPDGTSPPVVQFGRLPPNSRSARAIYANGAQESVPIGLDAFFVYQPSPGLQELARRTPMTLAFRDRDGSTWSYYLQPPQPLTVHGDHDISGRVVIAHAAKVEIDVAPKAGANAKQVFVPLHADGSFAWQGAPGSVVYRLTVRDANDVPLSADTGVLTPKAMREMSALAR
jgi:hypothetical protein